jgi:hypothetical protein
MTDTPSDVPTVPDLAARWVDALDKVAEAQADLATIKAEAKEAGYSLKILAQAVKEMRGGPEVQAKQLLAELELDTYRAALDLPTNAEDAQALALAEIKAGVGDEHQTDIEDAISASHGRKATRERRLDA